MKYKVFIDPKARQDLSEIFIYVALSDCLEAANKLLDKLEKTCFKLEKYPKRGHIPEELRTTGIKKYLEIYFKPYRIIYEIDNDLIYLHSVLDGRRNIQEILKERILK